ncbi:MAG TPA: 3-phosphoshikimate 1-carboxyvinyltransferase [Candidatus Kapabacteria bacterium]|nr:3-phosphoshikimate 1-carboxyvinyltransferase [Candidatus Kapabacteria bacterium]
MLVRISPVNRIVPDDSPVTLSMPPDKSILHRLLFLGSLTTSAFRIPIESPQTISHDIIATILALESLGVPVEITESEINMQGVGLRGYRAPSHAINCANSGTTARLLMGLLAGQTFSSTITGDASLSARPMKRLADLLSTMGAHIGTSKQGTLPAAIHGTKLHGAAITLPVASAQMKTAALFSSLFADGITRVREPAKSRDHTERMMAAFGFGIGGQDVIRLSPEIVATPPEEVEYQVPGDLSCAAFLIAAAVLLRKRIRIEGVSLNPSRTRFLEVLTLMGVELEAEDVVEEWNEPRGTLTVFGDRTSGNLLPFQIGAEDVPLLIDELPILMVLAIFADGESTIRGAAELRVKESDRLTLAAKQFEAFGVEVEELEDGIVIQGRPERRLANAVIHHGGDHRLAMAFSIAALFCDGVCEMEGAESASVSYPDFYAHLQLVAGKKSVEVRPA